MSERLNKLHLLRLTPSIPSVSINNQMFLKKIWKEDSLTRPIN